MRKMLLTVACLFAANPASAAVLQNITMDFYDATNVFTGYTTTVTGTLDTAVASGHMVGDVPFFGLIWTADEMWVSATAGANTWAGAALTTSYGAQTNFNYTFTLAPGDVAMGLYFDWSTNNNIPVLAVFHPEGDGSMSAVDQVWFKGTTTTPRMGMQTPPFPGQFPKFSGQLADPCAGVTCNQAGPCETGACVDGSCIYTYQCNDLTQDCVNNACVPKDPCAGVTCDNPGPCQVGQCVDGACVYNTTCTADQVCQNNACVPINSCAGVVCDQAGPCETGACVNGACVYTTTCAAAEECVNGQCVPTDNCLGVECPPPAEPCHTSACLEGLCISIPTCTANQQCVDNQCVDIDPCAGVVCDQAGPCQQANCVNGECVTTFCNETPGMYCVNDECVPDPCYQVNCPPMADCMIGECSREAGTAGECVYTGCPEGQVCQDEVCREPDACTNVVCDDGYVCTEGQCVPMEGKVEICHKGKVNLSIGAPALDAHLAHGDYLGQCAATSGKVKK